MISQPVHRFAWFVLLVAAGLAGCASAPERPDPASQAASVAYQQVGVPYRYGGNSPSGFDCSGLVQYAYSRVGGAAPRTTSALWQRTRPVDHENIRAGDILFFNVDGKMSHVGMYLGKRRFVHAPSTGKAVSIGSLDSPYYAQAFVRAGRL